MIGEEAVEALRHVLDPELGIDVVSLGLVRRIEIGDDTVRVLMTMTTPACPLSATMKRDAHEALEPVVEGRAVNIEIGFDPPWSPDDMSDEAREILGLG